MKLVSFTTQQNNIWNMYRYYSQTAVANLCGLILYNEKKDLLILKKAINNVIQNQTGLRICIANMKDGLQYVNEFKTIEIPVRRFEGVKELDAYASIFAQTNIHHENELLWKIIIVEVNDKTGILVVISHLISDGWSFQLMAELVDKSYDQIVKNESANGLFGDYLDYVKKDYEYLHSNRYLRDKEYWENKYQTSPDSTIIKVSSVPNHMIEARKYKEYLDKDCVSNILRYCENRNISIAVLFETIMLIYLGKINSDNQNVTVGIPVLNRNRISEKKSIGMYVSTLPLTVSVDQNQSIDSLFHEVKQTHYDLLKHEKFPLTQIYRSFRNAKQYNSTIYEVMVNYQEIERKENEEIKWYSNGSCEIPLVINIIFEKYLNKILIDIDYQEAYFPDSLEIEYIVKRIIYIFNQIIDGNKLNIREIDLTPDDEKSRLLNVYNKPPVQEIEYKCIHELFKNQVDKTPDSIALVSDNQTFSYKQIDLMSDHLAKQLVSKGLKPNDIVPIIMERNWRIVVSILAILKAGAAYMPIDIDWPIERIRKIVNDANCRYSCINNNDYGINSLIGINTNDIEDVSKKNNVNIPISNQNSVEDLCYVLFTSGSTGVPKGVMIRHRNVCNTIYWRNQNQESTAVINVTNVITDTFTEDLFCALTTGRTFYMISDNKSLKAVEQTLLDKKHLEIMATPTYLNTLFSSIDPSIRFDKITIVGEKADNNSFARIFERTAVLYNEYGPSECSICATRTKMLKMSSSIGKPISNTQIYILNNVANLQPSGIAGELCIAGDGVGLGYLNRSDLTSEKFTHNPFSSEENHHSQIMYHTGDLARWNMKGEIEYLGRIDTQVKIHGLRIELGEIENVISSFPGIKNTAVTEKKDLNNRQYLVGYYTSDHEIDERKLREYLFSKLPKYMVPHFFMKLEKIPMTTSGKLDRKNLSVPLYTSKLRKYIAPKTEQEKKLCELLKKLLHMENIGVEDDFFESGGDSLIAIEYVAKAHSIGIQMTLQNVFDYPTVRELCQFLNGGHQNEKVYFKGTDFDKYKKIIDNNVINESRDFKKKSLGNILLTGATGFLGAHLLDYLLKEEVGKIYCLVRCNEESKGSDRLRRVISHYFGEVYESEWNRRIIPIEGDIEMKYLANNMPMDVQTVIHTAASVKHYGSYDYFYKVNVEGTEHVISYAKKIGARMIHISTLSISGNSMAEDFTVNRFYEEISFSESSFYIGQPLDNVYIRSKFEAERAVFDAVLDGMNAVVIRVGNLTNRESDYVFQPNYKDNAFLTRVKAILEFGLFPDYLLQLYAEFSPIDKTAEGIVKIAQFASDQTVFHLNNDKVIYFNEFIEIVRKMGIAMEIIDEKAFSKALENTVKSGYTEYIYEAFQNDLDEHGRLMYDSNIHIDNQFTIWFLKRIGFSWNKTGSEYIKGYINYFRKLKYLEV